MTNTNAGIYERPVLFAYDGLDGAKAAIRQAASQLQDGRRAIVLTVWQPAGPSPAGRENPIERDARRVAEEGARLARVHGFEAEAIAERGDPVWERIVESAEERDASLVVLGAPWRDPLNPVPAGRVAAAAADHTARPLLIVHAPPPRSAA
jgi:nucleotide-binding universal stress UspA family protein